MRTFLLAFAAMVLTGTAHAQCGCPPESQWRMEIKIREATMKDVVATRNRAAIVAVVSLFTSGQMQAMIDSLENHSDNCSAMSKALADESGVEAQMIHDANQRDKPAEPKPKPTPAKPTPSL